jgi:hypothetical protein
MSGWKHARKAGAGLVPGLAGTLAITVTQALQKKLKGEPVEDIAPARAVEKALPLKTASAAEERALAQAAHWGYGTAWGRGPWLLDLARVPSRTAVVAETAALQGTAMAMLRALELSPPIGQMGVKEIATETAHHAVYAATGTWVYRRLARRVENSERRASLGRAAARRVLRRAAVP